MIQIGVILKLKIPLSGLQPKCVAFSKDNLRESFMYGRVLGTRCGGGPDSLDAQFLELAAFGSGSNAPHPLWDHPLTAQRSFILEFVVF